MTIDEHTPSGGWSFDDLARRLRERVGFVNRGTRGLRVTDALIRRFARAIGDTDPVHFDAEHAKERGFSSLLASPNLVTSIMNWREDQGTQRIRDDGFSFDDDLPGFVLDGMRVMGGGETTRFIRPVTSGLTIWRDSQLQGVELKTGKLGELLVLTFDTKYVDSRDEVVVTSTKTVLLR